MHNQTNEDKKSEILKNHTFINYLIATYFGSCLKSCYSEIYNKLDDLASFDYIFNSKFSNPEIKGNSNLVKFQTIKNEADENLKISPFKN